MDLTSLIIQIVAGIVGGNAAGKAMPNADIGALGNSIAGAIGGAGGGQLLQALSLHWQALREAAWISARSSANWSAAARAAPF